MGHYSQDMAAGQGNEVNNTLCGCRCSSPQHSAELWLWWMFSTPQLDELGSSSPDSRGDRVPPGSHPSSLVAQQCPTGATPAHTEGTGAAARLTQQWTGSGAGIKQSSSMDSQQQGTPGLWAARALPWSAGLGAVQTLQSTVRGTQREQMCSRSGFSAFLKLLLRRQH